MYLYLDLIFHQVDDVFLLPKINYVTFLSVDEEQSWLSKGISYIKSFVYKYGKHSVKKIYAIVFKIYISLLDEEYISQENNLNRSMFIRGLHSGFYGAYSMTNKTQYSWCKMTDKQPIMVGF